MKTSARRWVAVMIPQCPVSHGASTRKNIYQKMLKLIILSKTRSRKITSVTNQRPSVSGASASVVQTDFGMDRFVNCGAQMEYQNRGKPMNSHVGRSTNRLHHSGLAARNVVSMRTLWYVMVSKRWFSGCYCSWFMVNLDCLRVNWLKFCLKKVTIFADSNLFF